ncbi:hexokinase [Encephalitozoon romaleae SJ-2008]|uniref:Phosphotransferase n=1 Tax=Encephalitozoon romaleae (strain SJ-2008) TaxID=1178016 RepID=I7AQJ0_ENCRO|nr:hexokinase [Encephalitozoon romaleae SJ-2008]AFN84124.1 hexokinase [Encephalitozoon romaleae SJ-2008]
MFCILKRVEVVVVLIAGIFGMWSSVDGKQTTNKVTSFPIQDFEIQEIKKAFSERIAKAQEASSDGDFLRSHIDLIKSEVEHPRCSSFLVIDVGGTHLKIGEILIDFSFRKCGVNPLCFDGVIECSPSFYKYPDTSKIPNENRITWNEWVAEKIAEFYGQEPPKSGIDGCLTLSYPLLQTSINHATIERVTKNFCFKVDESTFGVNVVEALNSSLRDRNVNVHVNCVVNDSTATYMAGVLRGYNNIIGIVLGTGTNSSFCVKKKGSEEMVLYNSEWGSTNVPRSILTEADLAVITDLETRNISYNIIDVLAGGCKLNDIIFNRLKNLHPEVYEKYAGEEEVLRSMIHSAITEPSKSIFGEDIQLHRILISMINHFNTRGIKILGALSSAIIDSCMKDVQEVTLILNGMAFSNRKLREALEVEMKNAHPNIDVNLVFFGNASLEGSAFVSSMYSNDTNEL